VRTATVDCADETGRPKQAVRLIAKKLTNGDALVIGRNVDDSGRSRARNQEATLWSRRKTPICAKDVQ